VAGSWKLSWVLKTTSQKLICQNILSKFNPIKLKIKKIKYKQTFYKVASRKFSNQIPLYLNSKKEYNFRIRQAFSLQYSYYKDGFMSNPSWPKHLNSFASYFLFKHF